MMEALFGSRMRLSHISRVRHSREALLEHMHVNTHGILTIIQYDYWIHLALLFLSICS
jgi:hypothetical protein